MKTHISLLTFIIFLIPTALAQGSLNYTVKVKDTQGLPRANTKLVLIETNTFQRQEFQTDNNGELEFNLTEGVNWMVHVEEMKNYLLLNIPEGTTGEGSAVITYDPERWEKVNKKPLDRSLYQFNEENQNISANEMPGKNKSIINIKVVNEHQKPWANISVNLVCFELNKKIIGYTDSKGIARFEVPNSQTYQIDLDGEEDFEYIETKHQSSIRTLTLDYEKIDFKEMVDDEGYIIQTFYETPKPTSNRVMVQLFVHQHEQKGGDEIVLDMNYSNKSYKSQVGPDGKVVFMLPKKRVYTIQFKFQSGAGIVDLSRFRGKGFLQKSIHYKPDPRLAYPENYLPTASEVGQYDINAVSTKKYADTEDDNLINVHAVWGNQKINSGAKEALLELGFSVKNRAVGNVSRKPLNVSFVLDRSGSMSGVKIDLLKNTMLELVDKLDARDKISIILFDDKAVEAVPHGLLNKEHVKDAIHVINASGGTNIYDGLMMGYDAIDQYYDPNATNRLILLTDGYGSRPVDFIREQSASYFKKGIAVSTIGIGTECNTALLTMLSKYSGGFAHQVINDDDLSISLKTEFESLFSPLATHLNVTVKYNNRIIYKTLYGIPESKNTNSKVEFELGEVFSSLNKMALLKFKIENPARDIDKNEIEITTTYFDEQLGKEVRFVKKIHLDWTDETDAEMIQDQQTKAVYSMAVINQSLKAIADLCDQENYEAAKKNLHQTLKSLKRINNDQYTAELAPFIEQLKGYIAALDQAIKNSNE